MILCCGEALIDMIPTRALTGADCFAPHTGGSVFNTAIALGRLGAPAGFLGGLSSDLFGQLLRRDLQASYVDTTHVITSDRPTTLAFVRLIDGQAVYSFFDENSAGRMLTQADMPALPDTVSALFFGGISLACEPCADAYAALLAAGRKQRLTMMDPNIRTGFIPDVTRYRARLDRMLQQTDIVKVSDEDLNWLWPGPDPLETKAARLVANGAALVIVTRGGDGALAVRAEGAAVQVPARRVEVVDTVGAGDTFNAGILARLADRDMLERAAVQNMSEDTLEDVLHWASRAAAVTVSRAGADPPWASDLRAS